MEQCSHCATGTRWGLCIKFTLNFRQCKPGWSSLRSTMATMAGWETIHLNAKDRRDLEIWYWGTVLAVCGWTRPFSFSVTWWGRAEFLRRRQRYHFTNSSKLLYFLSSVTFLLPENTSQRTQPMSAVPHWHSGQNILSWKGSLKSSSWYLIAVGISELHQLMSERAEFAQHNVDKPIPVPYSHFTDFSQIVSVETSWHPPC